MNKRWQLFPALVICCVTWLNQKVHWACIWKGQNQITFLCIFLLILSSPYFKLIYLFHVGHVFESFCLHKEQHKLSALSVQFSSVAQSCPTLCHPMDCSMPGLPVSITNSGVHSISRPWSQWCHPTILSSVVPFSYCLQSFPASGSFQMSQFFTSGDQRIEFQLQHQSFQWIFRTDFL